MAKKSTKRKTASRKGVAKTASKARTSSNLQRLLVKKAIDPDAARNLDGTALRRIESLTKREVEALVSAHSKVSPRKRWRPDPDGSIF